MHFFKWLTKSLFAILMIGTMSACTTTPTTESADAGDSSQAAESTTAADSKDPKKAKSEALQNVDKGLESIFNEKSGLF